MTALETKISALDAGSPTEREHRIQERGALEQKIGEERGALERKIGQAQAEAEQRASAVLRARVERSLGLADVMKLEHRILPMLGATTRTTVGTLLSVTPSERVLAIETKEGRSRGFIIDEQLTAKGFCGGHEEHLRLTDIKPGTPILIAYNPERGRDVVRIVVKSSCA